MVEIVNIVAGGDLNRELDLETVKSELSNTEGVSAEFSGEGHWQLLIRFGEGGMVILYRTGKYILRGGSSFQDLDILKNNFLNIFEDTPIVSDNGGLSYNIQNIVFLEEFDSSVNLNQVAIQLGMENIEYEPEQFPGLIYRPKDFEPVMLVFATGKVIITGSTSEKEAEDAVESLRQIL